MSAMRSGENVMPAQAENANRYDLLAVVAAMIFPSIATWLYFVALAGHEAMQLAYSAVKILQFTFPLLWIAVIHKRRPKPAWPAKRGLLEGLAFGLLIGASMVVLYQWLVTHSSLLATGVEQVRAKVAEMGITTPWRFVGLALFYSLLHSLFEEYYWRWYVFGELRRFTGDWPAVALSSLAFMAHHVIVLGMYFGEAWWLTAMLSLSVAVGGAFWAWLYRRTGNLAGPWLSHALVDAAIMLVGYQMIWGR